MEHIVNPRRSPRVPARCAVQLVTAAGVVEAETEDLGAHGVQLVSPRQLRKGDLVRLTLRHRGVKEPLEAPGTVSWASAQAPWRAGIAFDEGAQRTAKRWYERLLDASPGMAVLDRVPERIAVDATVYLGAPPRFVLDFTPDEGAVLRAIGSGATVDDLRARLRDRWGARQRAIFSLLARNHVTLQRGEAVHPEAWKKILADIEASLALAELAEPDPALTPAPFDLGSSRPEPIIEVNRTTRTSDPRVPAAVPAPEATAPGTRSAEAQECFDRGLQEVAKGQAHTGVALLRRAAQLAPGDQEIMGALWKASSNASGLKR